MTSFDDIEQASLEKQSTFESVEQVIDRFRQEDGYIVDHRLATMVFNEHKANYFGGRKG